MKPAIVVVAFNREKALKRLLESLQKSYCPQDTTLIISIDRAEDNQNIFDIANNFNWTFGEKKVRYLVENVGLKKHIISCGDYSNEYGSVIILEDDLFVSPYFYEYAVQALEYYKQDSRIAGISLFRYPKIEKTTNPMPFEPLRDNSDVHFIQYASSWGQAWTKEQWNGFREWFDKDPFHEDYFPVTPFNVIYWPLKSWKKFFIFYMIEYDKYFVYPNISLTANFDDGGSNRSNKTYEYQVQLKTYAGNLVFKPLSEAQNVYNAYFELSARIIQQFNPKLKEYDFHVDLYGLMRKLEMHKEYILTIKKCKNPILTFARDLKPHEMNVLYDIQGGYIALCKVDDLLEDYHIVEDKPFSIEDFEYHYRPFFRIKELIKFAIQLIKKKLK